MSTNLRGDEVPVQSIPNNKRINALCEVYSKEFGSKPSFIVRVPGRVNIIGEHIDYCGYPVLPMALEQDILVAVGLLNEKNLYVRNANQKYEPLELKLNSFEDIDIKSDSSGKPYWYNYVLCGVKGAMEYLNDKIIKGLQLFVDGNVPPASGLSSSSALVSAACLSFLYAQNATLNKKEIASLCATSERYIGTQGGGMDQAIAFLAEKHSAQYITWKPLNATSVFLPQDAAFVVAHSLAEANKAATNDFNRRVIECRLAAKILATVTGASTDHKIVTLSDVQKILQNSLQDMIDLVLKHLPKEIYDKEEICQILNVSEEEMDSFFLTENTKHLREFKLKQRALHVYEEAMRVENFRKICTYASAHEETSVTNGSNLTARDNQNDNNFSTIESLGKLMSDSHDSLKNLYECSHDNLDQLVAISKKMGIHSRLTGAGWGGCIVALCPIEKVQKYIETLKTEYYAKKCEVDGDKIHNYVFATTPNDGAIIFTY